MALILKDRVKETCTGTNGNFTFAGAVSGYVAFSTVGNSNTTYYAIEDADGTKWEVGLGTLNADSSEIARTTVLSNQAGNTTTQTFSGGTHTIYCVYPADKSVHVGANIDIGSFSFTAETLVSDVSTGTAPITVSSTTKVTNLNADKLDDEEGSYYLDFGNFVIDDDEIPIAKLASDSVSFGGITVALGASDATPAFNLSDATNYPTSSLSGTITNAQLAGSIANAKLVNDGITIAGADTSLGGSITADTIAGQISVNTIAFTQIADLARGSILYGNGSAATAELTKGSANTVLQSDGTDISWATVTNAMLAGSIANAKLANDSVSYGGVSLDLGGTDATPAFDLADATNYPTSSLSGTITNAQLAGSIANAKLANSTITVAVGSDNTAISLGGTMTFAGTTNEVEVSESSGTVTIGLPNNVTIAGNLTVNGTTTTVNSTTLSVADPLIILASGNNAADSVDIGFYGLYDTSGSQDLYAGLFRDANDAGKFKLFKDLQDAPTTTVNTSGTGYAVATLVTNIEGDVTGDLTGNADTVTNGVYTTSKISVLAATSSSELAGVISDETGSGALVFANSPTLVTPALGTPSALVATNASGTAANLTAGTATVATTVTVADESSDTTCFPLFVTAATGDLGPKLGSNLTFNSSTGVLTATGFAGPLTGNVTGNVSGTAATVTTAAQGNITSLGTLTTLTVDDIAIDGKVITMTGSSDDTAVFTVGTHGTLSIVTTDTAASAANIQITADGTVDIDSAGVLTLDSGAAINIEPASGSAILLDGTISIDAGVVTGATSITSTAFVGNLTGNASGTAATVTGAAQSNITSLGILTALTVDDIGIDGKVITMTGSTSDTAVFTVGTNGTLSIVTTDDNAAAANIQITADGTVDIDSAGVLTLDSGAAINIEPADGSAILLDGTISIDAGVVTGATSITSTVFVGNVTGNVTGNTSGSSGSCTGNSATATLASTVTVTDSTSNTDFPVVFHDESNALLDDTGVFEYNPSTGTVTATVFSGSGASLTSLNGSNISSGTVAAARVATLNQDTAGTAAIATTVTVADESSDTTCFPLFVTGDTGNLAPKSGSNLTFNSSSGVLTAAGFAGPLTGNVTGNTSGSSGSCTGNAATATALASAVNIGGTSFDGTSSIVPGTITVADTTDTSSFVALFESATGNLAPKTDAGITYNAGTGTLTATAFAGPLTGNVTGNASGTALTVTQAAQTAITSLGTLTALTVDDVAIDGKVITMTGSTDDTAVFTVGTNGTLSIVTTDNAAAAANIEITADGTVDINSAGVLTLDSGAAINIEPADGSAILLDGTISIDAGVVTGATSITSTVFVGDVTGDVSGTAATVTGAAQTAITSLGTLTALTVDDVAVDGKVITMTGSANDTAVFTVGTNGTLSIVTTDTAAAAANVEITADGTVDINSAGVLTLDSGAAINIEPATGSAILLDGTISIDAGVVTGATSITSTAFVGDLTGNADTVTVTDSNSNTDFPVVFHDESNALLDDTAAFEYNPSTGTITLTGAVIDFNGTTGNNKLDLVDNIANGLDIVTGGSDSYMKFNTQTAGTEVTYSKEAVEISKPLKCSKAIHSSISKTNAVATSQSLKGGGTGNVVTLDLASAGFFRVQLTANVDEIWFKNQAEGQKVIIRFEQDGTGSRLVDFAEFYATDGTAVSVNFPGGTAPTLTTTASKADVIGFLNFGIPAGSVHYYNAVVIGQNFS